MAILDTYSNVTGAWSMDRELLASFAGGTKYTVATGVSSLNDQTGAGRHLVQATTTLQPAVITTVGGRTRTSASFDGVDDVLVGPAISNLITAGAGYIVAVCFPRVVNAIGISNQSDTIWCDSGTYTAVQLTGVSGSAPCLFYAWNYPGTTTTVQINQVPLNAITLVCEWKHEGGNLSFRINGDSWVSTPSGNTGALTGLFRLASSASGFSDTDVAIFEIVSFNAVPSVAQQDALIADMISHYGTTPSVLVNKMVVEAAYKKTNAYFDAAVVEKVVAHAAYRKLPFYLDGDDLRAGSLAGYNMGAMPILIGSTDAEAISVEQTFNIYILEVGAPALHSQWADRTGADTANLRVTTTGSTGTIYWVVTRHKIQPTPAQIIAGQNHLSVAAADSGTIAVSSVGQKTDTVTGITTSDFWAHFHHVAADAKKSNVVTAEVETFVAEDYLPAVTLVTRTTDLTTQDFSVGNPVISWDNTIYDENVAHDGTGSKIIVTPELHGKIGIFSARVVLSSITAVAGAFAGILKNGSRDFIGRGGQVREVGAGADGVASTVWMQCQTQPIVLVLGDEYQVHVGSTDNSVTFESEKSSFQLRAFSTITGCLMKKSADLTAANLSAFPEVVWNIDVYDRDGAHDIVTNTQRIVVPAAWNGKFGVFRGNVKLSLVLPNNVTALYTTKNGVTTWDGMGASLMDVANINEGWVEVETQAVPLVAGDYFSIQAYCNDTSVTIEEESSTFGVQIFDVVYGCVCKKSADAPSSNYSTPGAVIWNANVYDTHDLHSISVNNTKIIIPPSLNGRYAILRCTVSITLADTETTVSLKITKNGLSEYPGCGQESRNCGGVTSPRVQCATQVILLTTGDEFEAIYWCTDASVTFTAAQSSFGLQVMEVEYPFVAETFPLDGLSPSGVWSASRRLHASYIGPYYNLTTDLVDTWYGQVSARNFTQGTAGNRPLITASGPNSRAAVDCAGTDEFLSSVDNMSVFMSATEGYYAVSFMPDDVSYNQPNVHDSGPVVSDPSALHGIYIKKNSIQAMCNDGTFDFTSADFINAGGVHTAEWWHTDGVAYFRLDGGPIRPAPSGTMSSLAAVFRLAANRTINQFYNNIKIFEMVVCPTVPSLAAQDALVANMLGHIGGTVTTVDVDPHFANVVLLAGFDVGDGLVNSYIEEAKGAVGSWNGGAATDTGIVLVGEGSVLFTGGSLRFPTLADYRLSAANSDQFTIELKATTTTTTPANRALVWKIQNPAAEITWALATGAANNELRFIGSTTGTTFDMTPVETSGLTWVANTTYDIAVDKDATGKIRIYRNGVMVASGTPSNSAFHPGGAILSIGNDNQDIKGWAGSLDEIRITKNVARYASDSGYTPIAGKFPRSGPVPAIDPYFANVLLLMPFDGTIISGTYAADYSSYARVATFAGNAQIHTVFSKFGSAALLCDGTGDGVNIPDSDDWNFPGQFTIECFFRCSADNAAARTLVSHRNNTGGQSGWVLHYIAAASGNDTLTFAWSADGTTDITSLAYAATNAIPALQWHHAAVDRDASNVMRLYFNGVMVASATRSGSAFNNTQTLSIGSFATQLFSNHGYISEVRISNIARYASDSGFTVPTVPYPRSGPSPDPISPLWAVFDVGTVSNVLLTNNNLTAAHTNTTDNSGARSATLKNTGKYYFEVSISDFNGSFSLVGLITAAGTYPNIVTTGSNGALCYVSGNVYSNNTNTGKNVGALSDGSIVSVAADFDNDKVWFRKNGGNWQGEAIGLQDPANNIGGASISSYSATSMSPVVGFGGAGTSASENVTANFGAFAFAYTVPVGFTAGWPV